MRACACVCAYVAQRFEQCRETFIAVDTTKNNMISYDELRAAVEILGYKGTEEDLQLIFKHSDIDGSEGLSFRQFLITLLFLNILRDDDTVTTSPEVQRSFDIVTDAFLFFDKDRTGLLKLDEVLNGSYERKEGLPDGMVHVFEEMNTDGSGCVNLSEFVYALESWAGVDEQETSLLKGSAGEPKRPLSPHPLQKQKKEKNRNNRNRHRAHLHHCSLMSTITHSLCRESSSGTCKAQHEHDPFLQCVPPESATSQARVSETNTAEQAG